jgi:hypothetical protein
MLKRGIQGEKFFGQILGCKKAKLIFVKRSLNNLTRKIKFSTYRA